MIIDRIRNWLTPEEPVAPEVEQHEITWEIDVYDTTLHYENGDVETFETYGESDRTGSAVYLNVDITGGWNMGPHYSFTTHLVSFGVLSRDPIHTHVGTETWGATFDTIDGVPSHPSFEFELEDRDVDRELDEQETTEDERPKTGWA